jgi:hypothetical protein
VNKGLESGHVCDSGRRGGVGNCGETGVVNLRLRNGRTEDQRMMAQIRLILWVNSLTSRYLDLNILTSVMILSKVLRQDNQPVKR